MRRLYASTRGSFSTAHSYKQISWDEKTNAAEFGPCFSEFGHGHNYDLDVTFSVPRQLVTNEIAKNESEYSRVLQTVNALVTEVLQEFDHRHLNFTHTEFRSSKKISTTEVISEVLESSIQTKWSKLITAENNCSAVQFLGVQVWETHLLAASTPNALVCFARPKMPWSALKIQAAVSFINGESRSLELTFFESRKNKGLPPSLNAAAKTFLENAGGQFPNLESLCCALQENIGHDVLLRTKSNYFLFAGAEDAAAE